MITVIRKESDHSVAALCQLFEVSQSGYFSFLSRPESDRAKRRRALGKKIVSLFHEHKARYGRPRIFRVLQNQGEQVSEKMVGSLIRENALKCCKKRPFRPKTTQQDGSTKFIANLLKTPDPTSKNQTLVTDITYIATKEGWLYLSVIMNLNTKYIHAYQIENHLKTSLVTDTVEAALKKDPHLRGAILHSDRGCQYTSHAYAQKLKEYDLNISMSATGNCYDNATMESFFSTLKTEALPESAVFDSHEVTRQQIFEYIEGYYNTKRMHSSLNYLTPLAANLAA